MKLVRPLEDAWQSVLDATLRERGAPTTSDVERLGPKVAVLSRAYNAGHAGEVHAPPLPIEARIGFSFARDVPKGAAAVRDLVAQGALAIPEARPLRIVDVGAGLGAMTWGVVRALEAANLSGRVDALLIDEDHAVLAVAKTIADKAASRLTTAPVKLTVGVRTASIRPGLRLPEADLIVMGQVLSELDLALAPEDRVARHAAMLAEWLSSSVFAALVVVEPALRDRTRHLHAVRDAIVTATKARVFAPCLHALRCPAYAMDGEWCHDDLDVDLPDWLVPLARAAGLRWQGLTFSYLVLRAQDRSSPAASTSRQLESGPYTHARVAEPEAHRLRLRVISNVMRTKGKVEMFGCTESGERIRLRRLDRDANTAAWCELHRGDIVTLTAKGQRLIENGRIMPDVTFHVESNLNR